MHLQIGRYFQKLVFAHHVYSLNKSTEEWNWHVNAFQTLLTIEWRHTQLEKTIIVGITGVGTLIFECPSYVLETFF